MRSATTPRSDAGLSLVEVMVALAVFVIGSLSLLSVLASSGTGTFDNRARLVAANLAAADIDQARSLGYYQLAADSYTRQVDGRTYSVVRQVAVTLSTGLTGTSSCVASGNARELHKRVSTSVTTAFRGTTKPVRADTLVRAPLFDPSSNEGAIGFLVLNRAGAPLPGLPISVPGKDRTTDANGCAFFDGLPPATYTVTVTRPNSVTRDGRTALTKDVVVNKGQITSESMRVDTAIPVTVRAKAFVGSSAAPLPEWGVPWNLPNQPVHLTSPDRYTNTAIQSKVAQVATGADLVWQAYPAPGGYDAHIGACSVVRHLDAEPGTSPTVDLPFSPVSVHLRNSSTAAKSKSVTATWADAGCTEVLDFSSTTSSGCSGDADFNGNSCKIHIGLPAGRWVLKVSAANGGTTTATGSTPSPITVVAGASTQRVEISVS